MSADPALLGFLTVPVTVGSYPEIPGSHRSHIVRHPVQLGPWPGETRSQPSVQRSGY